MPVGWWWSMQIDVRQINTGEGGWAWKIVGANPEFEGADTCSFEAYGAMLYRVMEAHRFVTWLMASLGDPEWQFMRRAKELFPALCAWCTSQMTDYEPCPDCEEVYPWNVCGRCKATAHLEDLHAG